MLTTKFRNEKSIYFSETKTSNPPKGSSRYTIWVEPGIKDGQG